MRVACPRRTRCARALTAVVAGMAALLVGCGSSTTPPPGTPVVTMGDLTSSSDFASYIISIDSIVLTRNDGNQATLLPFAETVDFTGMNSLTQFVEAPAAPTGTYTSAIITLDYTVGSVWLNANGGTPVLASTETPSGIPLTQFALTVTFDPAHPLVITQGQSTRLQIDFDLAASNSPAATGNVVTVQPFVTMSVAPVDNTQLRVRGQFVVVPTGSNIPTGTSNVFIMNTSPFSDVVGTTLGAVNVNTSASTYWNINGVTYTGAAGLAAIGIQQISTLIVAYGTLDDLSGITPSFNATSVYAGTSQESPIFEYLTGLVSARSGDGFTLFGSLFLSPSGVVQFLPSTPVKIGSNTIISADGVATPGLNAASISVGQQINVSGQAALDPSTGALLSLDATIGQVRLQPSTVWGTLNQNPPPTTTSASLDVLSLGLFAPGNFNFAGTGAGGQDAIPSAYNVNTGSSDLSMVAPGTLLQVTGLAAPFGAAPPDFNATAITAGSTSNLQMLVVEWDNGGSPSPFLSSSSAGLIVNLADPHLGRVHVIRTGPTSIDLMTLPQSPLITTVGADQSNLDLAVGSVQLTTGVSVFNSATAFASELGGVFNGSGNNAFRLVAYGQYNSSTNTFVASRIHVSLQTAT